MKARLLTTLLAASALGVNAQTIINDTVTIGAGYANQVWYSLQNDEQGSQPKNNWDIAFEIQSIQSTIRINSAAGAMLWVYPNAKYSVTAWGNVDTTGLSTWAPRWNSDTSWTYGALGNYADPNDPTDLDWGHYDMSNHHINGDSIYIVQLVNGDYKKLFIESLISGVYSFKFANLDGSNETAVTLDKADYSGKNFGYFSMVNNAKLNREPIKENWDLVFTQYTGFVPTPYTLTGVLHNRGVRIAKAANLSNVGTYVSWQSHTFVTPINTIGYDWKHFNGSGYDIQDSLAYFIADIPGNIWKLVFTGFDHNTGTFIFYRQKLQSAGINDVEGNKVASMSVYPNPAKGQNVTVVYKLESNNETTAINVVDMTGRTVATDILQSGKGLHQYVINTSALKAGMYIVSVKTDNGTAQQRLIIY